MEICVYGIKFGFRCLKKWKKSTGLIRNATNKEEMFEKKT